MGAAGFVGFVDPSCEKGAGRTEKKERLRGEKVVQVRAIQFGIFFVSFNLSTNG